MPWPRFGVTDTVSVRVQRSACGHSDARCDDSSCPSRRVHIRTRARRGTRPHRSIRRLHHPQSVTSSRNLQRASSPSSDLAHRLARRLRLRDYLTIRNIRLRVLSDDNSSAISARVLALALTPALVMQTFSDIAAALVSKVANGRPSSATATATAPPTRPAPTSQGGIRNIAATSAPVFF